MKYAALNIGLGSRWKIIRKLILEKCLSNAISATMPPIEKHYFKVISVAILMSDHMVVSFARKNSKLKMFSTVISKLTIKTGSYKRIIIATCVTIRNFWTLYNFRLYFKGIKITYVQYSKRRYIRVCWRNIWTFILVRNLWNVVFVIFLLVKKPPFRIMKAASTPANGHINAILLDATIQDLFYFCLSVILSEPRSQYHWFYYSGTFWTM